MAAAKALPAWPLGKEARARCLCRMCGGVRQMEGETMSRL